MTSFTLALDCGSTNFKAALFDGSLHRLAEAARPLHLLEPDSDRLELNPEESWQMTTALIQHTCQQAGISVHEVGQYAITSQAQTFLLLDKRSRPITPLISWLDRRAVGQVPHLHQLLGKDFAHHCSFPEPIALLQLAKLLWLRHNNPGLLEQADCVASLPTWLGLRLGAPALIDDNLAAMSGLYSLQAGAYWTEALEVCGLREAQLPRVIPAGTSIQLQDGRLCLAGNDQTCGAVGNFCFSERGSIVPWLANLGTALVAYRLAGNESGPFHLHGCWGPYPSGGFYELGVEEYGCAALDWACKFLFPGRDLDFFFAVVRSTGGMPTALFYPDKIGSELAWRRLGRPDELARAVLEGIGFALRFLVFGTLGASADLPKLVITGGGARNDFWMQLLADILAVPVERGRGDSLLGAACLALPGIKPPLLSPPQTWMPDPRRARNYQGKLESWLIGRDWS